MFFPLKLQELFFPCQRGVFVVTSVLNGISLFCLLKKTPPNQFGVRVYLIAVQVIIILSSVYLDVLYAPIPVFPALACYCAGHLCMAGWSPHVVVGLYIALLYLMGLAIISCSLYRHQTIIPQNNPLRLDKTSRCIFQALLAGMMVCPIAYTLYPVDKDESVSHVTLSPFNISWIMDRGPFIMHNRDSITISIIYLTILYLIIFSSVVLSLFWHMFYVLKNTIAIPFTFAVIPCCTLLSSIACECIPSEVTLPAYSVLVLHPLLHNLTLLAVTPAYREFIATKILCGRSQKHCGPSN